MNPVTQDWGGLKGLVSQPRPRSSPTQFSPAYRDRVPPTHHRRNNGFVKPPKQYNMGFTTLTLCGGPVKNTLSFQHFTRMSPGRCSTLSSWTVRRFLSSLTGARPAWHAAWNRTSRRESWRAMRSDCWPHPREWSPSMSECRPQAMQGPGDRNTGSPSLYLTAATYSVSLMWRPSAKLGQFHCSRIDRLWSASLAHRPSPWGP